ncbi:iridoid oxidase-like [Hevea brasiliensis]|uniref:iridoid oxidase-like n=1 Tax=Hevea brasiliensis TaxID=3981 RepID=UPI0025F772FC|nr:iridoid oxidase-like [Hevea brasiliensis]
MESICSFLVCSGLFLAIAMILCLKGKNLGRRTKKLPPGPPGWPIIGNIFDLGTEPHRALQELKLKYGPVLRLRLGSMDTVVIQSAKAAAQLLKNHDASFCDRKPLDVFTCHNYRDGSLAVGRFSPYWRTVRRLCSVEMMTVKRINDTASIRRKCIDQMIRNIEDDTAAANARGESGVVNLPHYLFLMAFNRPFAGSETTSAATEWAMAELLRKPEAMRKVKEELNEVVGENRNVEESDIEKLPYLQAVVKEALRLHPSVPLLVPKNTMQDTNFMGYHIAKDTQVFVNAWAIGRDPDSWEDPLTFKPERFLGSNIDYKGQNFELIPFGSGRRICIGMLLAQRVLLLSLASLIHCFDWELDKDSTPEILDMREKIGMSVKKLVPLNVIPKRRPKMMAD